MANVNISGYGDDLTVNGTRIGDLSPQNHEASVQKYFIQNIKRKELLLKAKDR